MKDVASTVDSLRNGLNASNLAASAADAETLERLFQETEAFWTAFKTKDAIGAAKGARETAGAIADVAKAKDLQAKGDYGVIRRGGWTEGAQLSSFRNYADPEMRTLIVGFRCAK